MGRHAGDPSNVPWWLAGAACLVCAVLFIGGLSLAALGLDHAVASPATRTVSVPGPTVTVSYLLEKTTTVTATPAD